MPALSQSSGRLEHGRTVPSEARTFIRQFASALTTSELAPAPDFLEDAELLVSELVTNVVLHARTAVHIHCTATADKEGISLLVGVSDGSPCQISHGEEDLSSTHGRGLYLVNALAEEWWVTYGTDSKTVWFRLGPRAHNWNSQGTAFPCNMKALC
ncbi:ATP-binding protein [Streptomyces sp. NPDC019396]|uniref:ATP-binding protein n=1 Tax=Streptomyces sp. NPDC019396 TaxID=3154687 RepID=UPI0033EB5ECE